MTANLYSSVTHAPRTLIPGYPDPMKVFPHLSEYLGKSPRTIRRHISNGTLPGFKLGRTYYVSQSALVRFMEQGGEL